MIECDACLEPATIFSSVTDLENSRKYFCAECDTHYGVADLDLNEFWYLSEQDWQTDRLKEAL